eukprot:UN12417
MNNPLFQTPYLIPSPKESSGGFGSQLPDLDSFLKPTPKDSSDDLFASKTTDDTNIFGAKPNIFQSDSNNDDIFGDLSSKSTNDDLFGKQGLPDIVEQQAEMDLFKSQKCSKEERTGFK